MKYFKQLRGQALVEAALIVPLIIVFLFTIVYFASLVLTWQQIVTATKYGIDLIAYTDFDKKYIENDIKDYLCNAKTLGRTLDSKKLSIAIQINDYMPLDVDLLDITDLHSLDVFSSIKQLVPKKSFVEITYSYKMPRILKIIGKDNIKISSKLEVLSGTGNPKFSRRKTKYKERW
ncbi:MAG: pilus assembly protein [Endomicrobium sp.]|jgi:hypothetical protein|nr:pilus assembly protein [Endomicrobium sp.]